MGRIAVFSFNNLRKEELLGMSLEMAEKLREVKGIADSEQCKAFFKATKEYSIALDKGKELTYQDLAQVDAMVDQAISGLRLHLQVLLTYPEDETRESARQIWNSIEPYGSPTKLNFQEEYAIVARMLDTLESIDPGLLAKATVDAWVPALRERYNTFMATMKAYDAGHATTPPGTVKTAGRRLAQTWSQLCDFINGMAIVTPSDEIDALIAEINMRILSKKTSLKQRQTSKRTATEVAENPVLTFDE